MAAMHSCRSTSPPPGQKARPSSAFQTTMQGQVQRTPATAARLLSHTQMLSNMAVLEISVITVPGTKFTKPGKSTNRK